MFRITNKSNNEVMYATHGSVGFDIPANEDVVLGPGDVKAIATGLFIANPNSAAKSLTYRCIKDNERTSVDQTVEVLPELQIRSRSGMALKQHIFVLNSPGTVDPSFSLEIKVILANFGKKPFEIHQGDRIAQGVCTLTFKCGNVNTKDVVRTGGFGSTSI